jgi:formylmethanofuran dehydrogenase subunit E
VKKCDRCGDYFMDHTEFKEIKEEGLVCEFCIEEDEIMAEDDDESDENE